MSEFTLDDGRKAERVESNPDARTKVTEVYVEPKVSKKLNQRVIERFCVCEREIQTIDEATGEVVNSVLENLCSSNSAAVDKATPVRPMKKAVESRILANKNFGLYAFGAIIAVQVAALAYVLFFM